MGGVFTHRVGAIGGGVSYATDESVSEVSLTSTATTWRDSATLSVLVPVRYIGIWSIDVSTNVLASSAQARIMINGDTGGSGFGIFTAPPHHGPHEASSPVDYTSIGGLFSITNGNPSAATEIKLQYRAGNSTSQTLKYRNSRLSILRLGADDYVTDSTTMQVFSDTTANKTQATVGSLTFAPSALGDYIVFVSFHAQLGTVSSTTVMGAELTDGTTTTGERLVELNGRGPTTLMVQLSAVSGSKTVDLKFRQAGAGTSVIEISDIRFVALRKDRFANTYVTQLGADSAGAQTSYTDALSQTFTPSATNHLTLAGWIGSCNSTTTSAQVRYVDDGSVVNENIKEYFATTDGYGEGAFSHRIVTFAAASRTQVIQRLAESGATNARVQNKSYIVTLDLSNL